MAVEQINSPFRWRQKSRLSHVNVFYAIMVDSRAVELEAGEKTRR